MMGSEQFASIVFPVIIIGWALYGYITFIKVPLKDCPKPVIYWNWAGIFTCLTYVILVILENV